MKRLIPVLLTLLLLFSCAPAPQSSLPLPEDPAEQAAELFLRALEAFDTDGAESLLMLEKDEAESFFLGLDDRAFSLYNEVSFDTDSLPLYLQYAAGKMTHRITSSQREGKTAAVKAYVKWVDGSALLSSAYGAFKDATLAAGLNETDYPQLAPFIDSFVVSAVHEDAPQMKESVISFSLEEQNGQWKIRFQSELSSLFCACLFDDPKGLEQAMEAVGVPMS